MPGKQVLSPDEVSKIRMHLPKGTKNLRACLRCRIIMTKDQFVQLGCPTCRDVLRMQDDEARVTACTSTRFQGFITLMVPGAFVSRFCGLEKRKPGCYALAVQGSIPDHIINESEFERESEQEERLSRLGSEGAAPTPRSPGGNKSPAQQDSDSESAASEKPAGKSGGGDASPGSPAANIADSAIDKALAFADGGSDSEDNALTKKDMEAELFGDFNSEDESGPVGNLRKRSGDSQSHADSQTKSASDDKGLFSDDSPAEKKRRVGPEILEREGDTEFKQV
mmetsp:Transcript_26729/g.75518  ORF Transcript_26729/g.75518 Transcript_26729/m.75518 type:complete len:281 (+) Transcript_26729:133-975(+)